MNKIIIDIFKDHIICSNTFVKQKHKNFQSK